MMEAIVTTATDDEGPDRARPASPPDVQWLKARDTLLGAAPRGRGMDDGSEVEAEAALVLTGAGEQLIVIEGSYRRLLKTIDYARSALLGSAPRLVVTRDDEGVYGLRCPHCDFVTWEDDSSGIIEVRYSERYADRGVERAGNLLRLTGGAGEEPEAGVDHYECANCDRPIDLPDSSRVA
jgi:hypothetical protein